MTCPSAVRCLAHVVALWTVICAVPAHAARLVGTEENDVYVSSNDRHYTQGLRLSYLSDSVSADGLWAKPFDWLSGSILDSKTPETDRRIAWTVLGQSLFTPTDIHVAIPDPSDRPYAGWLYTGAALLQNHPTGTGAVLENVEVLLGVVGPAALGRQTQNDFHAFIKVRPALGWAYQLSNEPGLVISYDRTQRFDGPRIGPFETAVEPTFGATVGNVFTYGTAGGLVRFGQHLEADYGPAEIRPGISGSAWFDETAAQGRIGWSVFAGAQGRAVARNIFLDGNSFAASRSVPKNVFVADLAAGATLWLSRVLKVDFTVVERSPEFKNQRGWDRFGMIAVSIPFW